RAALGADDFGGDDLEVFALFHGAEDEVAADVHDPRVVGGEDERRIPIEVVGRSAAEAAAATTATTAAAATRIAAAARCRRIERRRRGRSFRSGTGHSSGSLATSATSRRSGRGILSGCASADRAALAGADVPSADDAALTLGVDQVRIIRIDAADETVAAASR